MAWIEQIERRTRNSKAWQDDINPAKFAIDSSIGSVHYHDGTAWQDINTTAVNSDDGNFVDMCNTAPYKFYGDNNGRRRLYPRRDHLDEYVDFARPQYWNNTAFVNLTVGSRTRTGNILSWDRPAFSMQVSLGTDGIGKTIILKNTNAAKRIRWPMTLTGLTWNNWQLVSIADGIPVANVRKPTLTDANGVAGSITSDYINGAVEFTADLTGLVYPITIDPTIDTQVGAGGNDGDWWESGSTFRNMDYHMWVGRYDNVPRNLFALFAIAGPGAGATCTTAYLTGTCETDWMPTYTVQTKVRAVLEDDPAAPTTYAGVEGATRTTAGVDWDSAAHHLLDTTYNSSEIKTVIQELWNAGYGLDGKHILFYVEDDGSAGGAGEYSVWDYYANDASSTKCFKLHIEYTEGGGGEFCKCKSIGFSESFSFTVNFSIC